MWQANIMTLIIHANSSPPPGLVPWDSGSRLRLGRKLLFLIRQVIDIDGDGLFLMNVQELACAHVEGIAAKAIIINNQHLGMVVQWESVDTTAIGAIHSWGYS